MNDFKIIAKVLPRLFLYISVMAVIVWGTVLIFDTKYISVQVSEPLEITVEYLVDLIYDYTDDELADSLRVWTGAVSRIDSVVATKFPACKRKSKEVVK